MINDGIRKFYWGFLFIMLSFRIQGFDILPDIVGYLFLASGFRALSEESTFFSKAAKYNIPMIILSIFSIYQRPAQGGGIDFGPMGLWSILFAIAGFIFNLLVVYNLFMGIREMAEKRGQYEIMEEAGNKWGQYKMLQIAVLFSFVLILIPPIAIVYFIVLFIISIILAVSILGFLKRCEGVLGY